MTTVQFNKRSQAIDMHETREELLETMFSIGYTLRLYSEHERQIADLHVNEVC
jgi:hypothetical protein